MSFKIDSEVELMSNNTLLSNYLTDKQYFSSRNIQNWDNLRSLSEQQALRTFHAAAESIPAYSHFLKSHKISAHTIKSITDFLSLPTTTKKNYVEKYSAHERAWPGTYSNMISTSSGTTGVPHFWPRSLEHEIDGAYAHEFIFERILSVNEPTLFIVGFAMGNWIAGTFTYMCSSLVSWKGCPLTVMTPGYSTEAILEILKHEAKNFKKIIITGHTPFLKEVVESAVSAQIPIDTNSIYLLGTGQAISENWRSYVSSLLGNTQDGQRIFNLYGSADASLMGFETPLSIQIRRYISDNPTLNKEIFNAERLPSLYVFDPRLTYLHAREGELHVTKNTGCPLINYNIQDEGGVLTADELLQKIGEGISSTNETFKEFSRIKMPYVYLFGRSKFMAKIYGANVYTDHVQQALDVELLQPFITGRFILGMEHSSTHDPILICRIELRKDNVASPDLVEKIKKQFITEVSQKNSEYKDALSRMNEKVHPQIILHPYGHEEYFPLGRIKKTA